MHSGSVIYLSIKYQSLSSPKRNPITSTSILSPHAFDIASNKAGRPERAFAGGIRSAGVSMAQWRQTLSSYRVPELLLTGILILQPLP